MVANMLLGIEYGMLWLEYGTIQSFLSLNLSHVVFCSVSAASLTIPAQFFTNDGHVSRHSSYLIRISYNYGSDI